MHFEIRRSFHISGSPCSINPRDIAAIAVTLRRRARPKRILIDSRVRASILLVGHSERPHRLTDSTTETRWQQASYGNFYSYTAGIQVMQRS